MRREKKQNFKMAKLELKKQQYQNTSSPTIGGKKAAAREHETN